MKLIKCVIQPHKLDEVIEGLDKVAAGATVSEVRGYGRQKGHTILYRGTEYEITLLPKIAIDIIADDNRVDDVVRLVTEKGRTGQIGDGRIFVIPLEGNYHIRSGFMDLD